MYIPLLLKIVIQVNLISLCMFNIDNVKQVKICKCSVQEFWDVTNEGFGAIPTLRVYRLPLVCNQSSCRHEPYNWTNRIVLRVPYVIQSSIRVKFSHFGSLMSVGNVLLYKRTNSSFGLILCSGALSITLSIREFV